MKPLTASSTHGEIIKRLNKLTEQNSDTDIDRWSRFTPEEIATIEDALYRTIDLYGGGTALKALANEIAAYQCS